jgi:RNA polymerase sigma-70 factor (ECF subfamily)
MMPSAPGRGACDGSGSQASGAVEKKWSWWPSRGRSLSCIDTVRGDATGYPAAETTPEPALVGKPPPAAERPTVQRGDSRPATFTFKQESDVSITAAVSLSHAASPDLEQRFRAFVELHRERAVRLAWRLTGGDQAVAEDVAQDAFLKALRALPRFRSEAELSTWFYRILVHQAHSHTRKRNTRRRLLELFRLQREATSAPRTPAQRDPGLQERIGRAIGRLSPAQREVFVLVHLERFTVSETATLLGKAPGTVKSHLHRALRALRRDLAAVYDAIGESS